VPLSTSSELLRPARRAVSPAGDRAGLAEARPSRRAAHFEHLVSETQIGGHGKLSFVDGSSKNGWYVQK
jgi:hypothetical protein